MDTGLQDVRLKEALKFASNYANSMLKAKCKPCSGTGRRPWLWFMTRKCRACNGHGFVILQRRSFKLAHPRTT